MSDLPGYIGPYKIEKELGRGGFAIVHLAKHRDSNDDQYVAIKQLNPTTSSDINLVKRFRRELRTTAKLDHQYIIKILDTDDNPKNPFIVMEYMPGGTLRDRLKEGPLPQIEAIHIVQCIGEALAYAHKQNVIHRDIKPGNILLDRPKSPVRPVLTDFGLVKLLTILDYDSGSAIPSTRVMGTLHYMAPEQWATNPTVTPSTDIYALSITFFEMLTQRRPFESNSPFELKDMHSDMPLPSLLDETPGFALFFDNVLRKAAAKQPSDRYQQMTDFIDALTKANQQAEKFEILSEIAKGGFATIYKAKHLSSDKFVALKILHSNNDDANDDWQQAKRFRQEARVVAKLNHPNIVDIIDMADHNDDEQVFFMAMEYVEGGSLQDKLKKGRLSRNEAIHIVQCIGSALSLAHEHKIIHRDLKPGNILLDVTQNPLRPVLSDFGTVKVLSINESQSVVVSIAGRPIGTQHYAAPEQWETSDKLTPATDIYALAGIFFEMLAGKHPFADSFPFPPEEVPLLSSHTSGVYAPFDGVLFKALDKEASNRYQTVDEFITAIEEANEQAQQAELEAKQAEADRLIDLAQRYLSLSNPDFRTAVNMIDQALELYPGYYPALRWKGNIYFRQGQTLEALEFYEQAYQQHPDPSSELGQEYLQTLGQAANLAWEASNYKEAIGYYEPFWQIMKEIDSDDKSIQARRELARTRLIEHYLRLGNELFAEGRPQNILDITNNLEAIIKKLETFKADQPLGDLSEELKTLQINFYKGIVQGQEAHIAEINTLDTQLRLGNEGILKHYGILNEAYQWLIELEVEGQWGEKQKQILQDKARFHHLFAQRSEEKRMLDYKNALHHYEAINQIMINYRHLSLEMEFDLVEKIKELKIKVNDDRNYREIRNLIAHKNYEEALQRLDQDFLRQGKYYHRDVSQILGYLSYATKHKKTHLIEWDGGLGTLEAISERLIPAQYARIEQIKVMLKPWTNFSSIIDDEHQTLSVRKEEKNKIETSLNQIETLVSNSDIDEYQQKIAEIAAYLEDWQAQLQEIQTNITPKMFAIWLETLETIEADLQKENQHIQGLRDILDVSDVKLEAIEDDPMFAKLQGLAHTRLEVTRSIERIYVQLQTQVIDVLIQGIQKNEAALITAQNEAQEKQNKLKDALTNLENDFTATQTQLTTTQHFLETTKNELGDTKSQLASIQENLETSKNELSRIKIDYKDQRQRLKLHTGLAMALVIVAIVYGVGLGLFLVDGIVSLLGLAVISIVVVLAGWYIWSQLSPFQKDDE